MILIGRLTKNTIPTVEVTDKIIKKSFSVWFKVKKKRKKKREKKKEKGPDSVIVRSRGSWVALHKLLSDVGLCSRQHWGPFTRPIHPALLKHSKLCFQGPKLLFLHKRLDQRFSHRWEPRSKSDYFQWNPPFSTCQLTMSVPLCRPWKSSPFWHNGGSMCIIASTAIYSWRKRGAPHPHTPSSPYFYMYFFFWRKIWATCPRGTQSALIHSHLFSLAAISKASLYAQKWFVQAGPSKQLW